MFLNLPMLAGLGGAVIPLILHLLARSRYQTVEWGAMMFLPGAAASHRQSARLKQYLLLAIRMLLVALVAVALARPVARSRLGPLEPSGKLSSVIILDRSYSLAYEEAGRSRFDKAREATLQILSGMKKGDEVALVLIGEQIVVRQPTTNLQAVAREVADLQVSSGSADMGLALAAARDLLEQRDRLNRELYLVTDRQAISWRNVDLSGSFRKFIDDPRSPTRFLVIPVGSEQTENIAVESMEVVNAMSIRNQPTEVEIKVHNYSLTPRTGMELDLHIMSPAEAPRRPGDPGRKIKTLSVTVGPRATYTARTTVSFPDIGSHVLAATIQAPGLEADNRFDAVIDVIPPIETLIISGDERAEDLRRESFFMRLALAPWQTAGKKGEDPAIVTVKPAEEFSALNLAKYQVIILANVPQLSIEQARALEQKVYEGAGLIICPGNLTRIENYNAVLFRDGLGLIPARLEPPTAADGSRATTLLGMELAHPIFRFRRGSDPLPSAVIARYFPAIPRQADARVLATCSSGEPFLIEGQRGRGRVLLITTPLDADWNTLPLGSFFLPFVQSMLRYAYTPASPPRNLEPGQPIVAAFDEPVEQFDVMRNDEIVLAPSAPLAQSQPRFNETQRPGIYRLGVRFKSGATRLLHYAVQTRRDESDLTPLTAAQWEKLQDELSFRRIDAEAGPVASALASERAGRELWLWMLIAACGLAVLEIGLTRFWWRDAA